jgi:hypothetical protein
MRFKRFTILALICYVGLWQNLTLAVGHLLLSSTPSYQDNAPSPNPGVPILPEGEEVKWPTSDSAEEALFLVTFTLDLNPFWCSVPGERPLPPLPCARDLLNSLHRLLI